MAEQQEVEAFLAHYGVKGMKWGVRKERRAANRTARRVKNAEKYIKEASVLQTKISELQRSLPESQRYSHKGYKTRKQITKLTEERRVAISNAKAKSEGKLTDKQRKMLIGAAVVGTIIAGGLLYTALQSGEATRMINKGKDLFKDEFDPGWKLDRSLADKKTTDGIMKDVVSKINPNYGTPGTKVNCRRATFAYEMRRRGYDVAATRTTNSHGQTAIGVHNALDISGKDLPDGKLRAPFNIVREAVTKQRDPGANTPMTDVLADGFGGMGENLIEEPTKIFSALRKEPDGARGELGMTWLGGGGHSVAWEIVGGKPVIFDTQSGKKYEEGSAEFREFASSMLTAGYTRLDNKTLDTNYLMRWVKDA